MKLFFYSSFLFSQIYKFYIYGIYSNFSAGIFEISTSWRRICLSKFETSIGSSDKTGTNGGSSFFAYIFLASKSENQGCARTSSTFWNRLDTSFSRHFLIKSSQSSDTSSLYFCLFGNLSFLCNIL